MCFRPSSSVCIANQQYRCRIVVPINQSTHASLGAPLDMGTDAFFACRKAEIESSITELQELSHDSLRAKIFATWHRHYNESCIGMAWQRYTPEQLSEVAICFGARKVHDAQMRVRLAITATDASGRLHRYSGCLQRTTPPGPRDCRISVFGDRSAMLMVW
jgi:hypothetical protein